MAAVPPRASYRCGVCYPLAPVRPRGCCDEAPFHLRRAWHAIADASRQGSTALHGSSARSLLGVSNYVIDPLADTKQCQRRR